MFLPVMPRIDLSTIQFAINAAPAFARVGLSVSDERLREQAVHALSVAILEHLRELPSRDSRQLTLPLAQEDEPRPNYDPAGLETYSRHSFGTAVIGDPQLISTFDCQGEASKHPPMTAAAALIAKRTSIVMRRALRILGDEDFVIPWLRQHNVWLGDSPLALMETAEGFDAVKTYLLQVKYGVYI